MAYAAVVSVVQILKQLLYTDGYGIEYPKPEIESLYGKVCSLQSSLDKIFPVPRKWRSEFCDLEDKITDAVYRAQDTIESFISSQILPAGDQSSSISISLQQIAKKLDPIAEAAEKMEVSMREGKEVTQKGGMVSENADQLLPYSSSRRKSTRIVGLDSDIERLKAEIFSEDNKHQVLPITGMGGIGKTTLAKTIYRDPHIQSRFHIRAWVTVSKKYHDRDVLWKILGSIEGMGQKLGNKASQLSYEQLSSNLYRSLHNNRYLIVIDDIWKKKVWDQLRDSFPNDTNGSRIIMTTRSPHVARYARTSYYHKMQPMCEDDGWSLLCEEIFGHRQCPPHLEKIGRKILRNCRGRPLFISVVGGLLSRERNIEYWRSLADDTTYAASDSDNRILSLCYNYLPNELKGCFLYMGGFPEDSEILASKLIKLWVAEGFLVPPPPPRTLEQVAEQHLEELIGRRLISIHELSSDGRVQTCGMHDALWELALHESTKKKFFSSVTGDESLLTLFFRPRQNIKSGRRIFFRKNDLMSVKNVYRRSSSNTIARTLVYAGSNYHYPLPFCLTFNLLRVLDTVAVYFNDLPSELFELIHLRYLALTYNGMLPPALSKLRSLQILIVRHHPDAIFINTSILPVEIWNMPQMRHILVTEIDFPDPSSAHGSVLLENLQSLLNVNASCCTKEVLDKMPNLKKFGMWIESPGVVHFYIDHLQQLEAFKFTVLKPIPGEKIDLLPKFVFPTTLKKLSLSGCGFPWEDMTVIGQLPCLQVLKLRKFAFQGSEWSPEGGQFHTLKFLLLESLDLENWVADASHFPSLERLIIRHCYELEKFPSDIGSLGSIELIELVDCSPSAVESAEDIKREQEENGNERLQVRINCSWK